MALYSRPRISPRQALRPPWIPALPTGGTTQALEGNATADVDAAAELALTKSVAADATSDVDAAGTLSVTKPLEGAGTADVDAAGEASVAKPIAGAATADADAAAEAAVTKPLQGAATVDVDAEASFAGEAALSGADTASATAAGEIGVTKPLAGAGTVDVDAAADASVVKSIAAAAAVDADAAGELGVTKPLAGSPTADVDAAAALTTTKPIAGGATVDVDAAGGLTVFAGEIDCSLNATETADVASLRLRGREQQTGGGHWHWPPIFPPIEPWRPTDLISTCYASVGEAAQDSASLRLRVATQSTMRLREATDQVRCIAAVGAASRAQVRELADCFAARVAPLATAAAATRESSVDTVLARTEVHDDELLLALFARLAA